MKVYIKAVSIEDMRKQYSEMPEEEFAELIGVDPTADYASGKRGKFMPWIFKQNKIGNLTKPEDYTEVRDALITFEKDKKAFPNPDLNSYKSVESFLDAFHVALANPSPLSNRQRHKRIKEALAGEATGDIEFLGSDGEWEVYTPKTFEGSIALAEVGCDKSQPYTYPQASDDNLKARWCTAASDYHYNSYTRRGPLYVFINRNDPINKFQSCPASGSWWFDKHDREQGQKAFFSFCDAHPGIKKALGISTLNGMVYMGDTCYGFDPTAKDIVLPNDYAWGSKYRIPDDIESVYIPDSVKIAEDMWGCTFKNKQHLKTIRLPETAKMIPAQFFYNCIALEEITIPDSVRVYGVDAFRGCSSLVTVHHSSNASIVRANCFYGCTSLVSQLPDSVQYIGENALKGCPNLDPIQMPANTNKIINQAFAGSSINGIELNNVTAVGSSSFKGSDISYIDISKLTHIGASAFRDCPNLQVVEFNPEGVTVGSLAFADNDMDGVITVNDNTELGLSVFDNCPNLTINWDKSDEPYEFENIRLLICSKTCTELIKTNKGYIPIEISEDGTRYEVE